MVAADAIAPAGRHDIELRSGARRMRLTVEGSRDAALADLRSLQAATPRVWRKFLQPGNGALHALLEELDSRGWIVERTRRRASSRGDITDRLRSGLDRMKSAQGGAAMRTIRSVVRAARRAAAVPGSRSTGAPGRSVLEHELLVAVLRHLHVEAPGTVDLLAALLDGRSTSATRACCSCPLDAAAVDVAIATAMYWALNAATRPTPLPRTMGRDRGLRPRSAALAIRDAEACLGAWEERAGPTTLLQRAWTASQIRSLARGIHLQQYYVSANYVASVIPVVRRSLEPELRALAWRYLAEETGHEHFELDACLRLGLARRDVIANAPLPAFATFHRVMSCLADTDVAAWVLAMPLAEGLPGQRKPLPQFLAANGFGDPELSAHVDVDASMDHAWLARKFADCLPAFSGAHWDWAMRQVYVVWSLTRLGWSQLVDVYGRRTTAASVTSAWEWSTGSLA